MVVRDKVGRKRYIVLSVDSEIVVSREDFERTVFSLCRGKGILHLIRPKLIDFDGRVGVLRCVHTGKEKAIAFLNSIKEVGGTKVRVETVKTSGTLRKARAIARRLARD